MDTLSLLMERAAHWRNLNLLLRTMVRSIKQKQVTHYYCYFYYYYYYYTIFSEEALKGSRKDMGTSPVKSPVNSNKAEPTSVSQEPPRSRYH